MENQQQPSDAKKAMEQELIRGRETANQLLDILVHKSNTHHHHGDLEDLMLLSFAQDLVRKVLRSFTNTLLLFNTNSNVPEEEVKVLPITPKDTADEACKSFIMNAKNRRGCYKRKSNALTWEKDSSILTEDGYAWRKYGQKMIMKKYIRSYYRCTHKDDQNCQAIKQVQRIQDDPPLYRTTYYGHHNCRSSLINSEVIKELDTTCSSSSSVFLNFNNNL